MYKPKEGKEHCKMLYTGCVVAVALMNSQQLWLPNQGLPKNKLVNILACSRKAFKS